MAFACKLHKSVWTCPPKSGAGGRPHVEKAPAWAQKLLDSVWAKYGRGDKPRLGFLKGANTSTSYGGRWFHDLNSIAVCATGERAFDRAVVLHELAHAILASKTKNVRGYHTDAFLALAAQLYTEHRIPADVVERIQPELQWSTS